MRNPGPRRYPCSALLSIWSLCIPVASAVAVVKSVLLLSCNSLSSYAQRVRVERACNPGVTQLATQEQHNDCTPHLQALHKHANYTPPIKPRNRPTQNASWKSKEIRGHRVQPWC